MMRDKKENGPPVKDKSPWATCGSDRGERNKFSYAQHKVLIVRSCEKIGFFFSKISLRLELNLMLFGARF
jgi:hypothetical protein